MRYTGAMEIESFYKTYHLALDEQQRAAVQCATGPLLLLAVPGSGKTTVLLARLGCLLFCHGVNPAEILTVTYTVSATRELRARFSKQFGAELGGRLQFRTINGICAKILLLFEHRTGRHPFDLMTDEGRLTALLGEIYRAKTQDYPTESELRGVRTQISYIKNEMLGADEIEELTLEGGTKLAPLYHEYCAVMRKNRWMDYDDQMVYALTILKSQPALLAHLRQSCRVLCVDEAQDTSRIQHCILRLLAGDGRGLFMVGDEDQSIYGFRAACPEALLDFEQTYPGAKVLLLERNYRSTPQIVAAADRFIAQNTARHPKTMRPTRPDGLAVQRFVCADRAAQFHFLAELAQKVSAGEGGGSTAVLYRENDTALPLIDLLARRGIPYRARQVEGGFFTCRIVRDITDLFALAADPCNADAFLRVYYKLGAPISRVAAQAAAQQSGFAHTPVLDALRAQELSAWVDGLVRSLQFQLKALGTDTAARALRRIMDEMGYGEYLDTHGIPRTRLAILEVLAAQEPTPAALLARLDALREIVRAGGTQPGGGGQAIILSTIHSSKGLEYDHVWLADVFDGMLPQTTPLGDMATPAELDALEEERRLFYVGMTRAKNSLHLICFSDYSLGSRFAEVLFPGQAAQPNFNLRSALPAALPGFTPPPRQPDTARYAAMQKDFLPGTKVRHRSFGTGRITARQDDFATIQFADGAEKRIALPNVLPNGILKIEW